MSTFDERVAERAAHHLPLATRLLREAVRIPADHVDRSPEEGGDPRCGQSNHEGPRLEYLRQAVIEVGAVRRPEDVDFDDYGNLVWQVEDPGDGVPAQHKRVIYLDGHADTVAALRSQWPERLGDGIDAFRGVADMSRIDRTALHERLGYLPPDDQWPHLLFGRGSADQLGGVVAQVVACKILLELEGQGALRGAIVRAFATASEEDNEGAGPAHVMARALASGRPEEIPDVVVLTEGTGDARQGALGIYRGQRGRMQIEVAITGRSCHGSMPWEGLNPLEHGGAILAEAARRYDSREGFLDHPFLGHGTRTASLARVETPSDCAVPERFVFRLDRRLTVGETPERALADVLSLETVRMARSAGLRVEVTVPPYRESTWRGFAVDNPQIYPSWLTPEDHPAVDAMVRAYRGVVAPQVEEPPGGAQGGALRREPRVGRWIFSTDGVGFPMPVARAAGVPERKRWVASGPTRHPAMIGIGPGIEQNTHKIGECVDLRELRHTIALLARFPSQYVAGAGR